MRKHISYMIVLAILLVSAQHSLAQNGGISIAAGAASFRMGDMKYLHEHILSTYPVEGKITSSFPPFTTASFTVFKQLYDHIRVGGRYNYSTTGAKSSYADYSGDIYTEFNAVSHRLGAYLSYLVLGGDRIDLSLNGSLDANYTSMTIQSYYTIFNYSDGLSNKYRSISPSIAVGGELMYKLKKLSLGMEAGYLVDLKGNLKDTSDGDPLLDPKDLDRVLSSDWTGWYLQLKTLIWLDF
ncbi:MAG: hypothetical protein GQ579_09645 [Bacteroidales bacterium]|nr:hypothetical protein [Bacteroidales bacterium]